jgi:hypothetical protein
MLKSQVDALVQLFEEDFETPEDLAKAVYAKSLEMFIETDTWGVAVGPHAYGPFINKAQAKKAAKFFGLDESAVRPLRGAANLKYDDAEAHPGRYCPDCEHPKAAHSFPGRLSSVGCIVGIKFVAKNKPPNTEGCCGCRNQYKEGK